MRSSKITLTVLLSIFYVACFAQTNKGQISGLVHDENSNAVEAATSSLLRAADSSVVKITASDKSGKFQLENIADGKYLACKPCSPKRR